MLFRLLLEGTIIFDFATFFLPVRAISKSPLSPCKPCNCIGELLDLSDQSVIPAMVNGYLTTSKGGERGTVHLDQVF